MTRCKMTVLFKDESGVKLEAVYDPDPESENGKFFSATPAGTIDLQILNKDAADQFEQGKEYYVDFTKCE